MTTRLVPVEIRNVSCRIDVRIDEDKEREAFAKQQEIIQKLRETFGNHVLLDELSTCFVGQIEKMVIRGQVQPSVAEQTARPPTPPPRQNSSQRPNLPPRDFVKNWVFEGGGLYAGKSLCCVGPSELFRTYQQNPNLFSPKDKQIIEAARYYASKPKDDTPNW